LDTGSLAELLSAFATIAAVVAATFAARAAIRTDNQQSVQLAVLEDGEHRRKRESVRSQADKVACWVSLVKETNEPLVHWTNLSGLPVYNLTFWVATPFGVTATKYSIGPPGDGPPRGLRRVQDALRELGEAQDAQVSWSSLLDKGILRSAVSFRDVGGKWWFRDYLGILTECHDDLAAEQAARIAAVELQGRG
jgi:hypothetical protein